ncbi:FitA-like ribbon-helix-helix domain-containing protein [Salinarimonas chemoclinalis]|uniref:FitA-like ribbon-helix-helix domain-containing protein n=1 Tax=Salinarimonas chemoclinalis TaxID=3241599 RepID=UPI00355699DD
MAVVTLHNFSDEAHRALKVRAASNKRSTEAEMRAILKEAALPEGRLRLGTTLWTMSREAGLTDEDVEMIESIRDRRPPEPISVE